MLSIFALTSMVFTLLATSAVAAPDAGGLFAPPGRARVVVPGGYTQQAPSNTVRPIQMAIEDGLEWLEVEVRRTKDGRHIVFDAAQLDGASPGGRLLTSYTLAELQAVDLGVGFAPRFAGERIMTLPECLSAVKDKIGLIVACRDVDPQRFVRELGEASLGDRVLVAGEPKVLASVRQRAAGGLATLESWSPEAPVKFWKEDAKPAAVNVAAVQATADVCRDFHTLGVAVVADACGPRDGPERWDSLIAAGADMVRTEVPEEFVVHAIAKRVKRPHVQYAAHRGASRYAPENTLQSLAKAARLHADYVEIDVRTTKDGGFFLLHDGNLDRTTTGRGAIRQATSQAVLKLDAGRWFGQPFAHANVPELTEYLSKFPPSMGLYFDAKDITPEALAEAVSRHGLVERTVVYQSPAYLEKLKAINPRIRHLPPAGSTAAVDTLAERLAPYAVDTPWRALSKDYIDHCHARSIRVFSDAPSGIGVDAYRQAIDWGIDLIQTDHPLKLWRAIEASDGAAGSHGE
ncbi:MAG: glycerophosphodiester phosphodiesterase [Planctomycetia bacterium]|nr:glycerophosphodiester phosphodiesterase [Planctomycetia bacterium]